MTTEAMFRLTKSETLELTPELAIEFAGMTPSPTERPLDKSRVAYLSDHITHGKAISFNWAKAQLGDNVIRVNGQHSSHVLAGLAQEPEAFPAGMRVHLDQYDVDNDAGLALLFRQFDARKSSRTPADVSGAHQMLHENLRDVPRDAAKFAVEGKAFFDEYVMGMPDAAKGDDRYMLFFEGELHSFIRWTGDTLNMKTPELKRAPVTAAMYGTFRHAEEQAREFWAEVARGGSQFEDSAPTTTLDEWLRLLKSKDCELKIKPVQIYIGCIIAWNAFRRTVPLKSIREGALKKYVDIE